jgi:hypothetical protein
VERRGTGVRRQDVEMRIRWARMALSGGEIWSGRQVVEDERWRQS